VLSVGTAYSTVQISSPIGQTGVFSIDWKITGDLTPIYYTPVKSSTIYVTSTLSNVMINSLLTIIQVPVKGCSIDV
jgi:hypothetical protein